MKKLIFLTLFFLFGCSHVVKSIWGTPIGEIKMKGLFENDCEIECKVYEYDDNFIELIDDYEHPWCICMTQCMYIDSSYCAPIINKPVNSLKNKIIYNKSIIKDTTSTN